MGLFKDMLKEGESVFRDTVALDYDYLPKLLPYREAEQRQCALAIKPLLQNRSGRHLFMYGAPGIGKTAACKHVLRELEEETDVLPLYVNCWKHNTVFKMLLELCRQLGIRLVANQKTSELFSRIKSFVNTKSVVFVFDEIDKIDDFDVLYMVLEDVYRKSIFLITNYKEKVEQLDERIMSRLNPELIEFMPYNAQETEGILRQRMKYAFVPGVWDNGAFLFIVQKAVAAGDIRKGLYLLRESGNIAEDHAARRITIDHVSKAIAKGDQFALSVNALDDALSLIVELVKKKPGQKSGDVFQLFLKNGGNMSYKNFTRKVEKLEKDRFITTQKTAGGKEGNTTLLFPYSERKLTEY
jgi:archaeal cell division control protein 6